MAAGFHSAVCGTEPRLLLYGREGWLRTTPPGQSDAAQGSWGCRDFGHCRWLSRCGLGARTQGSWGRSCPQSRCCGSGPPLPWPAGGQRRECTVSIRHCSTPSTTNPSFHHIQTASEGRFTLKSKHRGRESSVPSLAISLH